MHAAWVFTEEKEAVGRCLPPPPLTGRTDLRGLVVSVISMVNPTRWLSRSRRMCSRNLVAQ